MNFQVSYTKPNSKQLVGKFLEISLPNNSLLVSFDAINLFPNVSPSEESSTIHGLLLNKNCKLPLIEELMGFIVIVRGQNYFPFRGSYYNQTSCLTMVSPY